MSEARRAETRNTAALPQPGAAPATGAGAGAGTGTPAHSSRGPVRSPLARFFGVVARPQSWLNLLYLGLSFPLGLFYFVFLTVCLSIGISLVIIWVGIFILGLTAACWWAFAAFERSLADGLLGTRLGPSPQPWRRAEGAWPRIKAHFTSSATWKDLAFLFVKFPLGLLSFVVVVGLGASSLGFLGAPFYYRYVHSSGADGIVHHGIYFGVWTVDKLWQALLLVPLGLLLAVVSFHACNGLAALWRGVAGGLLTPDRAPRPTFAAASPAAEPASLVAELADPTARPAAPPSPGPPQADRPPYGWLYYPPSPYPPQPAQPPAAQPGATWSSGPWSGAPWAQWPPVFAASPAPPVAGPTGTGDVPPAAPAGPTSPEPAAPTPDLAAPPLQAADQAPNAAAPLPHTDGESPAQEEQP
jgi:hypothetical protein